MTEQEAFIHYKAAWSKMRLVEVEAAMQNIEQGRVADGYNILRNLATRLAWDAGQPDRVNELNTQDYKKYWPQKPKRDDLNVY